jgi:hypothetical protein
MTFIHCNWGASLTTGLLVFCLAWFPAPARGEFVTQMTGSEFFNPGAPIARSGGSSAPIGSSLSYNSPVDSALETINGKFAHDVFGTQIVADFDLGMKVTSVQTGPLGTTYTVDGGTPLPPIERNLILIVPQFGGGPPVHRASFDIFLDTIFVSKANPAVIEFSGTVKLVSSNVPGFDFSGFEDTGRFEATGSGGSVKDFNNFLITGGESSGSNLVWTMSASPTPSGIVLASVGVVFLGGVAWLRRSYSR